MKHFKGGSEGLNAQEFDFKDDTDLQVFLDLLLTKSQVWGWSYIFTIPVLDVATGTARNWNLLSHCGMIPMPSVRTHVLSYYATPSKLAQDSFMSCQCLLNSLTLDFLKTITSESAAYHVPALLASNGAVPAGALLLKLISISNAHVDSRATVTFIRNSLRKLDAKMIQLDSNVVEFNLYLKAQVLSLAQRGETTTDLLVNLFEGYKAADDVEFKDLLKRKENEYNEGKDVTVPNLMADMVAKCRSRVLHKEWSAPTKEQEEQILALSAQVQQLKSVQKAPKQPKPAGVVPKKAKKDNKWAWKDVLPQAGEATTKDFEGKQHHVNCPFHKDKWVCHTVDECSKNPKNASTGGPPTAGARPAGSRSRRLQAAQLAAALLEESEEGDEEDDAAEDAPP
jgi:hypothetical protein